MAFSVWITGYLKETGAPAFEMEPPWWPERELRQDDRFQASTTDGYLDYDADLSVAATRELHERFRPAATQGGFAYSGWQAQIQPMLATLDDVLGARVSEFARFHVCVFEWEAGLE